MSLKDSVMGFLKIDELKDNLIKLLEAKFELKKIEIIDKAKPKIADIIFKLILTVLGLFIYIFVMMALGLLIGNLLNANWLGVLIIAVVHAIILLIFVLQKESVMKVIGEKLEEMGGE
jgi:Putative Actinobacterial Holin-X, holin superfamily III